MSKLQDIIYNALKEWFQNKQILLNYRPEWLNGMEIDFFIPELNLAIEVQGRQHYYYCPFFHKSLKDYFNQIKRDKDKLLLIRSKGIKFIKVNEGDKNVLGGLQNKIRKKTIKIKNISTEIKISWKIHQKLLSKNMNKYPVFYIRKNNELCPVNKFASNFCKINKINKKIEEK